MANGVGTNQVGTNQVGANANGVGSNGVGSNEVVQSIDEELYIIKRDGTKEVLSFDKILKRVKALGTEKSPNLNVNYSQLVMKVVDQLYNNMPTYVIDELTAELCASLITKHLDYGTLAGRIIVSNNHKNTKAYFSFG